jgi:integrase
MAKVLRLAPPAPNFTPEEAVARLTKRLVEAIEPDPTRDVQRRDAELKGFGVRVQRSGVRSYFVQYRDLAGRTRRIALGRHGVLTTEEARKLAVQRLAEVARGENPSAARKLARSKARQTQTVKELVERFLREYVEAKRKPRTAAEYRRILTERVVKAFGSTAVDAVSREDVEALHLRMRRTPYEANRVLAVLSKMFNMAEAWRLRPLQSNPCYRIERYPERRRDRFLCDAELGRLGAALADFERTRTLSDGAIAALRLLAFTGCRASEVLELRWADVDLGEGLLRLPDAKAGARNVPLGAPAVALLGGLSRDSERVISGRTPGAALTLAALEKAWSKVRIAAVLENARVHDLRHTVGTFAGQAGLNAFTVRDILGHKTLAMTGRYVSQDTVPLRRAADQIAGRIASAFAAKPAIGG